MDRISTVALLAALLGMGWIAWDVSRAWQATASKSWPTAPGIITVSMVPDSPRHCGQDDLDYLHLYYTYDVDGAHYTKNQVFIGGPRCIGEWLAQRIVKRYPPGKAVLVYYDPDNPDTSVLEPGIPWYALGLWWKGGAVALALVVGVWRRKKPSASMGSFPAYRPRP